MRMGTVRIGVWGGVMRCLVDDLLLMCVCCGAGMSRFRGVSLSPAVESKVRDRKGRVVQLESLNPESTVDGKFDVEGARVWCRGECDLGVGMVLLRRWC